MEDFLKGLLDFLSFQVGEGIVDKLTFNFSNENQSALKTILESIWSWVGMSAMGLSVIYFLLEINQKIAFEGRDVTFKSLIAPFAKLTLSTVLFSKTGKIAGMCIGIFNGGISRMNGYEITATTSTSESMTQAIEKVTGGNIFAGMIVVLLIILIGIIAVLIQFVVNFLWDVKIFTFKIEFLWRLSTAPFNLADVYSDKNSQAFRFLKNMFALIMTGVAMVVLPKMAQAVVGDAMANLLTDNLTDSNTIKDGLTIVRAIIEVSIMPSFLALNCVSVAKQAIKEGLS